MITVSLFVYRGLDAIRSIAAFHDFLARAIPQNEFETFVVKEKARKLLTICILIRSFAFFNNFLKRLAVDSLVEDCGAFVDNFIAPDDFGAFDDDFGGWCFGSVHWLDVDSL